MVEKDKTNFNDLANFLFESGMLTRIKRSGDLLVSNPFAENVSDHVFRAMLIGYILAKLENVDENKVLKTLLFHDICETRILEFNKVASKYFNRDGAEKSAFADQVSYFSDEIAQELSKLNLELHEKSTKEAIVCKDADYLEAALAAKEAVEKSIDMKDWINNVEKALKTKSAKKLLQALKENSSNDWWKNLKYIPEIGRGEKKF